MAHRPADMHDVAPELTEAVAARVTTGELHNQALRDLGGFVHRTVNLLTGRSDGERTLQDLEAANAFVSSVDGSGPGRARS